MTRAGAALALALTMLPAVAHAETWWTQESLEDDYIPRIRFAPHIGLWAGEFDRTNRGCETILPGIVERRPSQAALRAEQDFPNFCPTENSNEIGLSAGASAIYRVIGPAHLSIGLDMVFTFPSRSSLKGQFIIAVPIAVGLTHDAWKVRPIVNATLTPYLGLPDLRRGFAYGGEGGLAVRIGGLAELQLVAGYHASSDWQMGIIRIAGYLP